jgi:hypothetical protein
MLLMETLYEYYSYYIIVMQETIEVHSVVI